ncbi:hypothetical protein [Pollutibacter soli]|uniref:anti-sigma factor family protein n=1 Tax=Pollutibacter soli TaxID=3034157 RepID=UPI0030141640
MKSCKKATFLISKKEEGKLTSSEAIGLAWHLSVCSFCRSFERQTSFFSSKMKGDKVEYNLPDETKTRLKESLRKLMDR